MGSKAAEQGHAAGQSFLAKMYENGKGIPEDYVKSYAWYSVTAAQGWDLAQTSKRSFEGRVTREQIAEAQKLSSELWEKYVVPFQED